MWKKNSGKSFWGFAGGHYFDTSSLQGVKEGALGSRRGEGGSQNETVGWEEDIPPEKN